MQHKRWLAGSVVAALAVTVSMACSSSDSTGGGPAASAGTAGSTTGGNAAGGAAGGKPAGGSVNASGTGPSGTAGSQSQSGSATGGAGQGGSGNPQGGTGNSGASGMSASGSSPGGAAGSSAGGASSGAPTAAQIMAKLGSCTAVHNPPFNPDEGSATKIDVCKTGSALWWKADMDVDCDGIQTPPCNTDNTGQPQTSVQSNDIPGGDVDPTKLPYFVMPLGNPETEWYTAYGVDLGQVGAVIYKGQVIYGVFADQAGGNFIGEASYKMCSLFIGANNCDPNNGGIDPLDVTYVTFSGTTPRVSGADFLDHDKHTALGEAAATAWLAQ
ncbi:MAG TPA: glycoside hydrolase family 75 protein [Polyangiaceae bacterium]|nr:glycoside hydrolase family 75 protein [Polyangiaceae bacterium]